VNVVKDLGASYSLVEKYAHWQKFEMHAFNPSRYASCLSESRADYPMPDELKAKFQEIVICQDAKAKSQLPKKLDSWWDRLCKTRQYSPTGPFPAPPANREELLKKWELERLEKEKKANA
jgi:hypothetical protein